MVSAAEGAGAKQGLAADLAEGVSTLSGNDSVLFTKYVRLVLPLDGYVFWVRADIVTPSALFNALGFNTSTFGRSQAIATPAPTVRVKGSFHFSTTQRQDEDETAGVNTVVFTALSPIQEFNNVSPNVLWIGSYVGNAPKESDASQIEFAFSQRGRFYREADLYHYVGTAVLPALKTQLIDSVAALAQRQLIVSNSLPIWLSLNGYKPPYDGFNNTVPLYPSFLVPDNLPPPYGVIHIGGDATEAWQLAPNFGPTMDQWQLARDRVRVTLYGLTNDAALTFLAAVEQFSLDRRNHFGILNMPIVRDDKRTQVELGVLAMKKVIDFDVSYHQHTARNIARKNIVKSIQGYDPQLPPTFGAP